MEGCATGMVDHHFDVANVGSLAHLLDNASESIPHKDALLSHIPLGSQVTTLGVYFHILMMFFR